MTRTMALVLFRIHSCEVLVHATQACTSGSIPALASGFTVYSTSEASRWFGFLLRQREHRARYGIGSGCECCGGESMWPSIPLSCGESPSEASIPSGGRICCQTHFSKMHADQWSCSALQLSCRSAVTCAASQARSIHPTSMNHGGSLSGRLMETTEGMSVPWRTLFLELRLKGFFQ